MIKPILLTLLVLTGCSTTLPDLPEQQYAISARGVAGFNKCAEQGHMSTALAAKGIQYVKNSLQQHNFSVQRLDYEYAIYVNRSVSRADCSSLAIKVETVSQEIDRDNQKVAQENKVWEEMAKSNKSTQTTCSKIGSQTYCTSY